MDDTIAPVIGSNKDTIPPIPCVKSPIKSSCFSETPENKSSKAFAIEEILLAILLTISRLDCMISASAFLFISTFLSEYALFIFSISSALPSAASKAFLYPSSSDFNSVSLSFSISAILLLSSVLFILVKSVKYFFFNSAISFSDASVIATSASAYFFIIACFNSPYFLVISVFSS